jgi:branched-subunit amino acid transport protein
MTELLAVLGLAVACWFLRVTFVLLVPADKLPRRVRRSLDHMAPAVLAALASVEVSQTMTSADLRSVLTTLVLLGLVGLVAFLWRNLTLTVVAAIVGIAVIDVLLPLITAS